MMESVLLGILAAGSVVTAILLRLVALDVKRLLAEVALARTSIGDLGGPLYDTKRKQDEVLAAVGKHTEEVIGLLTSIRDLNHKELNEKREILSHTNIAATSRITNMRSWLSKLEDAAEKEILGLGAGR